MRVLLAAVLRHVARQNLSQSSLVASSYERAADYLKIRCYLRNKRGNTYERKLYRGDQKAQPVVDWMD